MNYDSQKIMLIFHAAKCFWVLEDGYVKLEYLHKVSYVNRRLAFLLVHIYVRYKGCYLIPFISECLNKTSRQRMTCCSWITYNESFIWYVRKIIVISYPLTPAYVSFRKMVLIIYKLGNFEITCSKFLRKKLDEGERRWGWCGRDLSRNMKMKMRFSKCSRKSCS